MGWFRQKVAITFVDDLSGEILGSSEMVPEDLPESFDAASTLHWGEADWSVVHAEPRTRPEYMTSGKLIIRLQRIEKIDPSNIPFSLPSICDRLPISGTSPILGDECLLAEDDWRQFEFVSSQLAADSIIEIESIRNIHEKERDSVGWKKLHVRCRVDPPIITPLPRQRLDQAFGGLVFRGVRFHGSGSPIVSGFSFRATDGLECYGIEDAGRVSVLGVVTDEDFPSSPPENSISVLARIAQEFGLELIDWCRCARALPDSPLFHQLLGGD